MEYKLINNLWQFLKRWKDLPMIRTDEFMADLEDSITVEGSNQRTETVNHVDVYGCGGLLTRNEEVGVCLGG